MTSGFGMQPDQYFPPAVTNASPGFSAFSQKTQEDWQTEIDNSWMATLGPLADLCTLVDSLPIVKSLMDYGSSFAAGNTANILHGIQLATNDLSSLICTIAGDVDINGIIAGANALMNAANANAFYTLIVDIGQAIEGVSGNVLVDLINGSDHWLTDFMTFLGNPVGFGTGILSGVIPALRIAGLDATKIVSGQFPQNMIVNLETDLADLGSAISSGSVQAVWDAILHSVGIAAGAGGQTETTAYFTNLLSMFANPGLVPSGTFNPGAAVSTFITDMINPTNLLAPLESLVSGSYTVPPINVPGLDTSKITSGVFPQNMLTITSLAAGVITSGTFNAAQIPGLDATKIISGVLNTLQIPNLDAAKIVSGVLAAAQIPGLDASKIITGVLAVAAIPALPATIITSGLFNAAQIPGLDATKIITGVLGAARIPNITAGMSTDLQTVIDGVYQATHGGTLTGNLPSTVKTSLLNFPGANVVSTLAAAVIPALDASKITTGVLATAQVAWAAPIDTLIQSWGGTGTGHTTTDLATFAANIGTDFIQGVSGIGGTNVGESVANHVDTLVQAIQALPSTAVGNSLGVLGSAMAALRGFLGYSPSAPPAPTSVAGITNTNNTFITNTAITKAIGANIDPTMIGVFDLQDLKTATLTTVGDTQGATLIGFITATEAATKQSIQWLGYPSGGNFNSITDIRLNIYKMVSGVSTFVYQTPNIVGAVATGSSPVWNAFNLSSGNYLTVAQGDVYAVELQVMGGGTYNVVGVTSTIPQHLTAIPAMSGATRNNVTAYGPPAPAFQTVGTSAGNGALNTITWTHTFNGTETFLLVPVESILQAGGGTWNVTVGGRTCLGGPAMNPITGSGINTWYIFPPAGQATFSAGAQTVTAALSGYYLAGNSFGYSNCVGYNTTPTAASTTGSPTQSISNKANALIVQCIWGGASTLTAYTQTQRYNLAYGTPYAMLVGDMAGVAGTVTGAATMTSGTWGSLMLELIPPAPPASVPAPGGTSAFQYSTKTPFFGLSGAAGTTQYPPQLIPIYNTQSLTNPAVTYPQFNHFDVILAGDGGGGNVGAGTHAFGLGGSAGAWATAVTLSRAQMGTANLACTIGGGGAGTTTAGANGANGAGSTIAITGYGTITAGGGAGGTGSISTPPTAGAALADLSYNGRTYPGGAGGSAYGGAGGQPGGGGGGGGTGISGGGNGGPGIGYIYCYI